MDYAEVKDWKYDIPFQWIDDDYGRAEFVICPVWRHKKIREVYITTVQLKTHGRWVWKNLKCDSLSISSYDGLDPAKVWISGWCNDHKTQFIRLYVPNDSSILGVKVLSSFSLAFKR